MGEGKGTPPVICVIAGRPIVILMIINDGNTRITTDKDATEKTKLRGHTYLTEHRLTMLANARMMQNRKLTSKVRSL